MWPKCTAAAYDEASQALVRAPKKSRIAPAALPPDPIPNGLETVMAEIADHVRMTRRRLLRQRFDVHYAQGIPGDDPT
jgi:hypothetical protein